MLLRLSQPLKAVTVAGAERSYSESELEEACAKAYAQGKSDAEAVFQQEQAAVLDAQRLTLEKLAKHHDTLVADFCKLFPNAVEEAVSKVLSGFEPDQEQLMRIVSELVSEAHPKTGGLEVFLSERDLEIFRNSEPLFEQKYPGICFVADSDLKPGDSMVRSRFGTLDGRISTKLRKVRELLE